MEKYREIQQIGKGSFGVVKKVARVSDGAHFVWKAINYRDMTTREKQQLVTEVNLLRELNHQNIVKYCDRIIDKEKFIIYIIMQYCEGGDLGQLLKSMKHSKETALPQQVIWKIFLQLVQALHYCHSRETGKIIHRDIKPANIFIDAAKNIKLGDFGLSRQMGEYSEFAKTHVGTPFYMSPEQINEDKYNEKSDIWSAGCVLYEMAALRRPFEATTPMALAQKIQAGRFERIPFRYSWNLQELIAQMLVVDPAKRISTDRILKAPILAVRLEEKQLKDKWRALRKHEEEVQKRQKALKSELAALTIRLERSQCFNENRNQLYSSSHEDTKISERDCRRLGYGETGIQEREGFAVGTTL